MLVALLLLVSSALLTLPALVGVQTLISATSLLSFSSLFASFVLLVSSASIAIFLQLAVLSLTRWWARRPASPGSYAPVSSDAPVSRASGSLLSPAHASLVPVSPAASLAVASSAAVPVAVPAVVPLAVSSSASPAVPEAVTASPGASGGFGKRSLRLVPFLLAALALLPGCTQATAAQAVTPATCGSAAPDQVVASAALQDGKASPAPHRVSVPLGSQVRLGVSVDTAAQIHVHGYDLEYQVAPGQPTCIVFVASQSGLFDVEAHPDTLLLQLEVK